MESNQPPLGSGEKDSFIVCRNNQGTPVRGSLMHFSNQNAIFEVYNPFSILQLSEVLSDFRIIIGNRTLYAGRGVVSSLVNTGIMLVCEVTLVDPWNAVDVLSIVSNPELFRGEVNRFVAEWRINNNILPEFKVLTSDFQGLLSELSLWLKQVEVTVSQVAAKESESVIVALVDKVVESLEPLASEFFEKLEEIASQIPPEEAGVHKGYLRRDVHPLTLCSPFVHRTFTKPLGYAGDFEMINMILERPYEGRTLLAKTITKLLVGAAPAEAHRNRIEMLKTLLREEVARAQASGRPFTVLNVGCGPAKEVREFIAENKNADLCRITLMDFSKEALTFARAKTMEQKAESNSAIELNFLEKSIDELLRESIAASRDPHRAGPATRYDLVYCAGLFDYLTDTVCRRLISLFYDWVTPGGLVSVTNIHVSNPQRHLMEYLLDWNVFHRTEREFENLGPPDGQKEVVADKTGVNIFLNIRRNP